jgi:predicted dinucleotide-binding enzyme
MLQIAVIGTGNIGGRLAKVWAHAGHRIYLGTRNPLNDSIRSLVQHPKQILFC